VQHGQCLHAREVAQGFASIGARDNCALRTNKLVITEYQLAAALNTAENSAGRVLQRVERMTARVQTLLTHDRPAGEYQFFTIGRNRAPIAQCHADKMPS
jgi:hypothetical protein